MKRVLKAFAAKITAAMNRLGEDFDMLLMENILPDPSDWTELESFDEELFV